MSFYEDRKARTAEFMKDRFGMFIHWGLYAVPARCAWMRSYEHLTDEQYQVYFDEFDPVDYDPHEWARLAKAAGMKYAVLTTKHHEGFCLFDSQYTDFKATNTPAKRDLVREYVDAFRAEGLKVGFYYSLIDWHHPDYPHYGDETHPQKGDPACGNEDRDFSRYVEYLHNQVRELCTNYGKIDILWFDYSYGDMRGEKWEATKLVNMIRELQPGIIIDNRLGAPTDRGEYVMDEPPVYAGDFESPEKLIPPNGMMDTHGRDIPWEACMTLNDNWGYASYDKNFKDPKTVIRMLVECASKGGNMLINVGPNAKGKIPVESVNILKEVGEWMDVNSESIYGCGKAELPKPEWGRYTQKGNVLYAHVYDFINSPIMLPGLADRIGKARFLYDASEARVFVPWNAGEIKGCAFLNIGDRRLPDDRDTVIRIELK